MNDDMKEGADSWRRQFTGAAHLPGDDIESALASVEAMSARRRVPRTKVAGAAMTILVVAAFVAGNVTSQTSVATKLASSMGIHDRGTDHAPAPTITTTPSTTARPGLNESTAVPVPTTAVYAAERPATVGVDGDVDGDGTPDKVSVSKLNGTTAKLTVVMSKIGTQSVDVPANTLLPGVPNVLATHDIDADGSGEVLVTTSAGASTGFGLIIRLVDRKLVVMRDAAGQPFQFSLGGSVGHDSGFRCIYQGAAGAGTRAFATTGAGFEGAALESSWQGTVDTYKLDGAVMRKLQSKTVKYAKPDAIRFNNYYGSVECDDLALTGSFSITSSN